MAKKRPFHTFYFGRDGTIARIGRASTLRGAVRGATSKVYLRQFFGAQITLHGRVVVNVSLQGKTLTVKRK